MDYLRSVYLACSFFFLTMSHFSVEYFFFHCNISVLTYVGNSDSPILFLHKTVNFCSRLIFALTLLADNLKLPKVFLDLLRELCFNFAIDLSAKS